MRSLILLGSTGSIGTQCLDVLRAHPGQFQLNGLAAGSSWREAVDQVREFDCPALALADRDAATLAREALPESVRLFEGPQAAADMAGALDYDLALNGVVGAAGLQPSVRVLERGCDLALANKESLVIAGQLLMDLALANKSRILPVDSEHSALQQCLHGEQVGRVRYLYLTASGGALRDLTLEELHEVTPEVALAHPTWTMGPRITIGSATLMNKALEVIEAAHLYGVGAERIRVVIHRQSIVHSMVEYVDGSVISQLGPPDMRGPIHHALFYPDRIASDLKGYVPELFQNLTFEEPDPERFPALELGYRCVREGGNAGAVLNAADEVAVAAFLDGQLPFHELVPVVSAVLDRRHEWPGSTLAELLEADRGARKAAKEEIMRLVPTGATD
ncbi:MAG: 1-deoxy-D-xylulose-5-phosphate reductoisomerase [Planctomycetota bacterium]|nr:1-deoxy-D-xylulose-5-phosphate reductoisomerase [Planctomycetota bacterium]MDG2143463.1 1-deoxy-D-xylulose-5-phosphate reductoisomerase [Planctomycetota bacterium]